MNLAEQFRKWVLQNAIKYEGKANAGAVIGKVLQEDPSLKAKIKEVVKIVNDIIKEVNKIPLKKQLEELQKTAPELLEKQKVEEKKELPELKNAIIEKVVTRIAPEPSKYNHIGHALSFLLNYLYAKKYKGKCILRFEDTNPEKSTDEYLHAMQEDIAWLGIKTDKTVIVSNDMSKFYELAEKLIKQENAYACLCDRETMKKKRMKGEECECRTHAVKENMTTWEKMINKTYKEEEACLRLKGNMKSNNGTMRDPVLFRINHHPHFLHDTTYSVWPTYDFENAVEEELCGITHVFRSAEFVERAELQEYIRKLLGFSPKEITEYGRFNVIGTTTKGREIRHLIEDGKMIGWDDPRLVTLRAIRRRGIVPETVNELLLNMGLKKDQANISWDMIAAINRKILDDKVKRYFFIDNPEKITIAGSPPLNPKLHLHPDHPEWGERTFKTGPEFYITRKDNDSLKQRKLYRLMDCLNFTKTTKGFKFESTEHSKYKEKGEKILHWLPTNMNLQEVEILMPDATTTKGLAEEGVKKLKEGDIIQFERFGFCRLDRKEKDKIIFWYTHK